MPHDAVQPHSFVSQVLVLMLFCPLSPLMRSNSSRLGSTSYATHSERRYCCNKRTLARRLSALASFQVKELETDNANMRQFGKEKQNQVHHSAIRLVIDSRPSSDRFLHQVVMLEQKVASLETVVDDMTRRAKDLAAENARVASERDALAENVKKLTRDLKRLGARLYFSLVFSLATPKPLKNMHRDTNPLFALRSLQAIHPEHNRNRRRWQPDRILRGFPNRGARLQLCTPECVKRPSPHRTCGIPQLLRGPHRSDRLQACPIW